MDSQDYNNNISKVYRQLDTMKTQQQLYVEVCSYASMHLFMSYNKLRSIVVMSCSRGLLLHEYRAEHAIRFAMISQMCSCSFMAMTFVVLALWLSADPTQILNDLLLQCAYVNHVAVCAFAFSAMNALI